jgi:hypothetical protein
MNLKKLATQFALFGAMVGLTAMPLTSNAQTVTHWIERQTKTSEHNKHHGDHRQNQKNDWRNLGYVGAGAAVLGVLTHDPLLAGIGVTGGLYSAWRYEQDRKSQNAADRRRYAFFSKPTRTMHGHKYRRVTVTDHGHKYYAYKRA